MSAAGGGQRRAAETDLRHARLAGTRP